MKIAVIVAAGLATRLYPITKVIPKVLVNNGQETILKGLIKTYKNLEADTVMVIVPPEFEAMTKAYLNQEGLECEVRTCDRADGSAFAINTVIDELIGHNVVFNWSDVQPHFINFKWDADTIYTYGDKCRYYYDGHVLANLGSTGGNVVGVYQVAEVKPLKENIGDFVDAYDFSGFIQSGLSNLQDIGDMDKLRALIPEANRSFNSIEYHDDEVHKYALTQAGSILQKREVEWYRAAEDEFDFVWTANLRAYEPANRKIVLEYIQGKPLIDALQQGQVRLNKVVKKLLSNLMGKKLVMDEMDVVSDFKMEFYDKVVQRNESIRPLLNQFRHITKVNGVELLGENDLLTRAHHYLSHTLTDEDLNYRVIHGDLNFSNVIVENTTNDLFLIDPRGYFGKSEIYGPAVYDRAKVLYAISGYDQFNRDPAFDGFTYVGDDEVRIDIKPLSDFTVWTGHKREKLMVGIIWMALAGYFKNNPYKSIAAYFYGRYLMTQFWNHAL